MLHSNLIWMYVSSNSFHRGVFTHLRLWCVSHTLSRVHLVCVFGKRTPTRANLSKHTVSQCVGLCLKWLQSRAGVHVSHSPSRK